MKQGKKERVVENLLEAAQLWQNGIAAAGASDEATGIWFWSQDFGLIGPGTAILHDRAITCSIALSEVACLDQCDLVSVGKAAR